MSTRVLLDGRIFYPHFLWEDASAGLYNIGSGEEKILNSIKLLSDQEEFWDCMCQMRIDWKYSFEYNVSNYTQNRQAWLGQAACFYNHCAEFNLTIAAWNLLSLQTQKEANSTAQRMIDLFLRETPYVKNTTKPKCLRRCDRTHEMDL